MRQVLLPAALLLATGAAPAPPGAIEVTVSGIRVATGKIVVAVCPERQFLKTCVYSRDAPARAGDVTVVMPAVPPGRYAVQVLADANANGRLDRNFVGIPREGVGFSNNAMRRFLPPRFAAAAFDHGAAPQRLAIALRYFPG